MCLNGVSCFFTLSSKSWGRHSRIEGDGSREGSSGIWWAKPAWWPPPAQTDATCCLFMETAQLTDAPGKLTQKHIQANLLRFIGAVLWLLSLFLSFKKTVEEPLYCSWNEWKCVSPVFGDALQVLKAFFIIPLLYTSLRKHFSKRMQSVEAMSNSGIYSVYLVIRKWYLTKQKLGLALIWSTGWERDLGICNFVFKNWVIPHKSSLALYAHFAALD